MATALSPFRIPGGSLRGFCMAACCAAALSACTKPEIKSPDYVNDPREAQNRYVHEENKKLDRSVFRPLANAYGAVVPAPVDRGIENMANNLDEPNQLMNNLLQLKLGGALRNTARFATNSTVGIAGIFDVASMIGIKPTETDFGETLYTWGFDEGRYVEMPIFGPANQRDSIGRLVDLFFNPISTTLTEAQSSLSTVVGVSNLVAFRHRSAGIIDAVLYESEDSYITMRTAYLQNRRYQLSGQADAGDDEDFEFELEDPDAYDY